MMITYLCGDRGLQNGFVKVDGRVVPNRIVRQVSTGTVVTASGDIQGSVQLFLFNGDVAIPDDLYTEMYPE